MAIDDNTLTKRHLRKLTALRRAMGDELVTTKNPKP